MHVKTMEGLIGARTNMNLLNTPFRVYKEAERKGDFAKMEQAMGYMVEYHEDACEYKEEADEGMKKDAENTRKIAEKQREEAIQKRKEEREEFENRIEESRKGDANTDSVEISEDGKALLRGSTASDSMGVEEIELDAGKADAIKPDNVKEPVTYTSTGETVSVKQSTSISVSV